MRNRRKWRRDIGEKEGNRRKGELRAFKKKITLRNETVKEKERKEKAWDWRRTE